MNILDWLTALRIAFSLADLISKTIQLVQDKHGNDQSPDFKPGADRKEIVVGAASEFVDGLLLNLKVAPELVAYLKQEGIANLVELLYRIWRWTGGKP